MRHAAIDESMLMDGVQDGLPFRSAQSQRRWATSSFLTLLFTLGLARLIPLLCSSKLRFENLAPPKTRSGMSNSQAGFAFTQLDREIHYDLFHGGKSS